MPIETGFQRFLLSFFIAVNESLTWRGFQGFSVDYPATPSARFPVVSDECIRIVMSDPEFESFLRDRADLQDLSKSERQAFVLAIAGDNIKTISEKLNANESAIRQRLSQVYKKFGVDGTGPVKLKKLKQLIESDYQDSKTQIAPKTVQKSGLQNPRTDRLKREPVDWGEAPDVPAFYGRAEELDTLEQKIIEDRCRLVALLGFAGIGKTALASVLAKRIEGKFDRLIWRSLRNAPLPERLLEDWLEFLSGSSLEGDQNIQRQISQLVEGLCEERCLLVLDDFNAVLTGGSRLKPYEEKYEAYGTLLRQVAQLEHQSCLLLVSSEKPREIDLLERATKTVDSLSIDGLDVEDAKKILKDARLKEEEKWNDLIKIGNYNTLQIKNIARYIKEVFDGSVSAFLKEKTWVFGESSESFNEAFARFSPLEGEIICYLATKSKPSSYQEIKDKLISDFTSSQLIENLASLKSKFWIQTMPSKESSTAQLYKLPELLKKYVIRYQLPKSKK